MCLAVGVYVCVYLYTRVCVCVWRRVPSWPVSSSNSAFFFSSGFSVALFSSSAGVRPGFLHKRAEKSGNRQAPCRSEDPPASMTVAPTVIEVLRLRRWRSGFGKLREICGMSERKTCRSPERLVFMAHDTSNILYIGFNIFERPFLEKRHQCRSILSMLESNVLKSKIQKMYRAKHFVLVWFPFVLWEHEAFWDYGEKDFCTG